jgi:cation transport ATPase
MLTGESRLISKKIGDTVYGGTMVVEGTATVVVTTCGDASALGRIVSSVQEAQVRVLVWIRVISVYICKSMYIYVYVPNLNPNSNPDPILGI